MKKEKRKKKPKVSYRVICPHCKRRGEYIAIPKEEYGDHLEKVHGYKRPNTRKKKKKK
ncbi:MAG: hypothetical protein GOU97_04540 [Nanoarchaeota archaeon]|nr:hypothetical protein [Nanoarchaeota archaeon]